MSIRLRMAAAVRPNKITVSDRELAAVRMQRTRVPPRLEPHDQTTSLKIDEPLVRELGMNRVNVDVPAAKSRALHHSEKPVTVCFEIIPRLPDLEHLHVVLAIGGVGYPTFRVARSRRLEVLDHVLVVLA